MKRLFVLLILAVLALPVVIAGVAPIPAHAATPGGERERDTPGLDADFVSGWREADAAMESGEARAMRAPDEARGDFVTAAEAYGRAARVHPSAVLLANLGTAHLRAGDSGRAIAALRAALLLYPASERATANLVEARRGIAGDAPSPDARTIDAVRAWWAPIGGELRALGWFAWCLGLAAIGLAAIEPGGALRRAWAPGWLVALFGCLCLASAAIDALAIASDRTVVLTLPSVPRSGNGQGFSPVRSAPLPAGTECSLREERPGWTEVELGDGTRGWIEADRVESVAALLRAR